MQTEDQHTENLDDFEKLHHPICFGGVSQLPENYEIEHRFESMATQTERSEIVSIECFQG
jgi:hypothetical protein